LLSANRISPHYVFFFRLLLLFSDILLSFFGLNRSLPSVRFTQNKLLKIHILWASDTSLGRDRTIVRLRIQNKHILDTSEQTPMPWLGREPIGGRRQCLRPFASLFSNTSDLCCSSRFRPQHPCKITSNSYAKHSTPCNGSNEVLLPTLEGEVRKEKDRVILSDQREKLLLITSENCQNMYGVRTRSVVT
jgi:hypothetical protein